MKRKSVLSWCIALLFLAGVIIYVNLPGHEVQAQPFSSDYSSIPVGSELGKRCAEFSVETAGGGQFRLSEHLGKPVVINFWATWCGPCVLELPNFQQLSDTYSEQLSVIALHASLLTEDWLAYLNDYDYTIPFALDADGSILTSLGGSMMLPQTVVIDRNGVIVYNKTGSLDYPTLEAIILPLLQK